MKKLSKVDFEIFNKDNNLVRNLYSLERYLPAKYRFKGTGLNYVLNRNTRRPSNIMRGLNSGDLNFIKFKYNLCNTLNEKYGNSVFNAQGFTQLRVDMTCPTDMMMLPENDASAARSRLGLTELNNEKLFIKVIDLIISEVNQAPTVMCRLNPISACGGPTHSFDYAAKLQVMDDISRDGFYYEKLLDLMKSKNYKDVVLQYGFLPFTVMITRKHSKATKVDNGHVVSLKEKTTRTPSSVKGLSNSKTVISTLHPDNNFRKYCSTEVTRQVFAPSVLFTLCIQFEAARFIDFMSKWPIFAYHGSDDVQKRLLAWNKRYGGKTSLFAADIASQGDSHHPHLIKKITEMGRGVARQASCMCASASTIVGRFLRDVPDSTVIIGDLDFNEEAYASKTFQSGHPYVVVINWIGALADLVTSYLLYKNLDETISDELLHQVYNDIKYQRNDEFILFLKGDDQIGNETQKSEFFSFYLNTSNYNLKEEKPVKFLGDYFRDLSDDFKPYVCIGRAYDLRLNNERDIKFKTFPLTGLKVITERLWELDSESIGRDFFEFLQQPIHPIGESLWSNYSRIEHENLMRGTVTPHYGTSIIDSANLSDIDLEVLNDPAKLYYKYDVSDVHPEVVELCYKTIKIDDIERILHV